MAGRQTVMITLKVTTPDFGINTATANIFTDLQPGSRFMMVPFTLDFNCPHNIINRKWLLELCQDTGTRIDIRPFNGYIRPVTLASPKRCFTTIVEDLCHLFVQMPGSSEMVEMEFFVMDGVFNTISGHTSHGIRAAKEMYKDPSTGPWHQASVSGSSTSSSGTKRLKTSSTPSPPTLIDGGHSIARLVRSKEPPYVERAMDNSFASIRQRRLPLDPSASQLHISRPLIRSPAVLSICTWIPEGLAPQPYPFHFDNGSLFPVIPESLVTTLGVYTHVHAQGIELVLGYSGRKYKARRYCYLYILLPGDTVVRITPFLVADNLCVDYILMPVHTAPLAIVQQYLESVISPDPANQGQSVFPFGVLVHSPSFRSSRLHCRLTSRVCASSIQVVELGPLSASWPSALATFGVSRQILHPEPRLWLVSS